MPTEGEKKNDVPASQRATEFMTGYCRSTRICYCHESENACPLFLSTSTNQPIGCHVRLKFSSRIESILVVLKWMLRFALSIPTKIPSQFSRDNFHASRNPPITIFLGTWPVYTCFPGTCQESRLREVTILFTVPIHFTILKKKMSYSSALAFCGRYVEIICKMWQSLITDDFVFFFLQ